MDLVVHEVRTSFIVVIGGAAGRARPVHYSSRRSAPGEAPGVLQVGGRAAPGCARSPRPAPCAYAARCRRPPRRGRRRRRRRGCAAGAAPVSTVRAARCFPAPRPGRSGRPQRTAKYASPARSEAKSPSPRVPSGKIPSTPPSSSTPSALGDGRAVGGRSGPPSAARCRAGTGPSGPTNASFLIRKCTGRGAVPITIGPSMLCEWLTARITGPVGGHPPGAEHPRLPQPVHQADADPAPDRGAAPSAASAPRWLRSLRGPLLLDEGDDALDDLLEGQLGGVHLDGVVRLGQRRGLAAGVGRVPLDQRLAGGGQTSAPLQLAAAAGGARLRARR